MQAFGKGWQGHGHGRGYLTCMATVVANERSLGSEGSVTQLTAEVFFLAVGRHMRTQDVGLQKKEKVPAMFSGLWSNLLSSFTVFSSSWNILRHFGRSEWVARHIDDRTVTHRLEGFVTELTDVTALLIDRQHELGVLRNFRGLGILLAGLLVWSCRLLGGHSNGFIWIHETFLSIFHQLQWWSASSGHFNIYTLQKGEDAILLG